MLESSLLSSSLCKFSYHKNRYWFFFCCDTIACLAPLAVTPSGEIVQISKAENEALMQGLFPSRVLLHPLVPWYNYASQMLVVYLPLLALRSLIQWLLIIR